LSLVQPNRDNSQHNGSSMTAGDNWIGSVVNAIEQGPEWRSTAVFITYDDCGCFYDHMPPPSGLSLRVPMVIVSPYAKPGYTDSTIASFASLLAYTEHVLSLATLGAADSTAYDYSSSFNYSQTPLSGSTLTTRRVPRSSLRWIRRHPPSLRDPT
jgi:phospholipase C